MDDSNIHIVKRTDQWKERAVQSYVVPRGVLCVELTPDGNTRIKIGEGNKYYSQLPYIGANIDISKYFTKEEVKKLVEDTSEATVVAYMDKQPYVRVLGPILPSASALPKTGNKDGDIRFVKMAKVTPDGKAYIEYVWFNNRWDPLSSAIDIDVSKFATKEELAAVQKTANELAKRVTLLEQAKHIHLNKSIIDSITAPFTTELAAKLAGIEPNANKYVLPIATRHSLGGIIIGEGLLIDASGKVTVDTSGIIVPPYDDTEVKRRLSNLETVAHTHTNKAILDATTASYTSVEKTKLAGLENYDDTALSGRVTTLEESSHTHTNKSVLDNTTASYTTEEQTKLAGLENYTLPTASSNTLGGIKVGSNLSIDQNGVLSAESGEKYVAGDGISFEELHSDYDSSSPYYFTGTTMCTINGREYWRPDSSAGHPCYAWISRHMDGNVGPIVVSKNQDDVTVYWTGGTQQWLSTVTYNGETWYVSKNAWWYNGNVTSTDIYWPFESGGSEDVTTAVLQVLSQMHPDEQITGTMITNTGVLDVTKDNNGDLVVSKTTGDTTLQLDHYTLPTATDSQLGGIKVGSNLSIDQNGVLSATGGAGYTAGDGINIRTETIGSEYDTSSEYYSIDETDLCYIGSSFTLTSERAALPKYAFVASHYSNNWNGPVLFSKNPEAVKYDTRGYTSNPVAFTYNNETWYRSDNGYWYQNSSISTNIKVDDLTGVVYDESDLVDYICSLLDTMHTESHTETIIENTGVLDVTKDNNGDLVVSTINGDTTLPLDHYALPTASSNTLGGVKVGDGLSIDQDGILSADGSIVYRAGTGISIETASGGDPSIYDTTHPYYSDTQTSAILDCPGRRRTYTRTTTNPAYVVISRVKNTGGSPYYWYTVYVISKNINDTLCNFLDSDHFSGRSSTADAVSVTIDGTTWYGNGYMISLGDIDPVGDVNEVVPYFESEETSATDTVAAILDYIYSDDTSKYIVNTGVLDVTKNASGNLVVSKESGDTTITLPQEYTLPIASANDLGGVIIGDGISVDENGVISVAGGESGDYRAGDGIEIVEQTEPSVVEIDISDGWVNKVVTSGGSRSTMDDNKTYMRFRYPCTPGQKFKLRFTPSNATDVVYFNVYGFSSDGAGSGGQKMYPLDGDWSTDQTAEITVLDGYPSVDFTLRLNNPGWGQGSDITAASFSEMVMIVQEDVPVGEKYINVTPATTTDIGGIKVGDGLSITSDGTLSANAGVEYVAGDGISIDEGSSTTDIASLAWEQGSINPINGEPDDFTTTVIRSPMIEVGLTNMLNVSAQDTSDNDMRWEAAFYDSNSEFISMITTWQTLSDEVIRPDNAKYVVILLRKESETEIDENALKACEISWPIEIGKYVVTNTGVTHVGLTDDGSVIYVENGSTNTLLTFGQDLDVTNGVVSIPDYHRLVLNVEE